MLEVSAEPLEIIQANECDGDSLASSRFRRIFRELDDARQFRQSVADALDVLRAEMARTHTSGGYSFHSLSMSEAIKRLDATVAALGLPAPTTDTHTSPPSP